MSWPKADRQAAAYLLIEKGSAKDKGSYFPLQGNKLWVGRPTSSFCPEICLNNFLISRKHCCIEKCGDEWLISDLGSRHGTAINGQPLGVSARHALRPGDKIVLAAGVAVLRVILEAYEQTLDFDDTKPRDASSPSPVVVDMDKMKLSVDDRVIRLSGKEWQLLEVLYEHRGKFVSYDELRERVWAERPVSVNKLPDVGSDEINVLIYRLRRKLGDRGKMIRTIRGRGCIFELPVEKPLPPK